MIDDDRPYVVPLNYGYSDNSIYMHSAESGKKIAILKQNNRVCFEIEYSAEIVKHELSCGWSTRYRSLIGIGTIEIITDFEQKKAGLDIIMAHYGKKDNNEYKNNLVNSIVILKLNIEEITGKQSGIWD